METHAKREHGLNGDQPGSHAARALRGVPWTLLAYAFSRGLTLIGTLALARLLDPADFGVVITGMVLIFALNIISEGGFGGSLVVREDVDDQVLGTILVCMVGTAVVAAAICAAASPLLAWVFDAPRLNEVMPFLALTVIPSTLGYFYIGILQREMHFERRFWGQLAMAVFYVGVAVPAAAFGAGIWSLVAGFAAGQIAFALVLWRLSTSRPKPHFAFARLRESFRHARGFVAETLTEFAGNNIHFVVVSSMLGTTVMGAYSMGYRLAEIPAMGFARPIAEATFPAVARMGDERERRSSMLVTSLTYLCLIGLPFLGCVAALAPAFVDGVLGPKWHDVTAPLQVLCVWGVAAMLAAALRLFVGGTGNPGWVAKLGLARLLVITPLLFTVAFVFDSAVAVAAVIAAEVSVEVLLILRYARRRLHVDTSTLRSALVGVVVAAAGCGAAAFAGRLLAEQAGAGSLEQLVLGALLGVCAYVGLIALLDRALLTRGLDLFRRATGIGARRAGAPS